MNNMGFTRRYIALLFLCALALGGCASAQKHDNALAFVDGDPITKGDLEYALEIAHRREDLSTAQTLDIDQYVKKLIDDRMIVHEARRMGMDEYPEVREKVQAFTLRESVVRLYSEEVLEKVIVHEEEIIDFYKTNYERFTLEIIETGTEEEAETILAELKEGEDFTRFSREYPASFHKQEGKGFVFTSKSMNPDMKAAVDDLSSGDFGDITTIKEKYYIFKVISREAPPAEELENVRKSIAGILRPQKTKEREDEYLEQLRQEASINIDQELLSSIQFNAGGEGKETWMADERTLVEVNGESLSVGEFAAMLSSSDQTKKENTVKGWLDRKLVDQEALKRQYAEKTDLKYKVYSYENQLMKNTFFTHVIASKVHVSEDDVKEYYLKNQKAFMRPVRYKIQQITLDTREKAVHAFKSLQEGANFAWLARTRSVDNYAEQSGVAGWKGKEGLPLPLREMIDTLEPGDNSPILETDGRFLIVRLLEKTGKEPEEFARVKAVAYKAVHRKKFFEIYDDYVKELREKARIEINEDVLRPYREMF
jgi:parvulin-like peptidyl-prolyl isomerase